MVFWIEINLNRVIHQSLWNTASILHSGLKKNTKWHRAPHCLRQISLTLVIKSREKCMRKWKVLLIHVSSYPLHFLNKLESVQSMDMYLISAIPFFVPDKAVLTLFYFPFVKYYRRSGEWFINHEEPFKGQHNKVNRLSSLGLKEIHLESFSLSSQPQSAPGPGWQP